MGEDEATRDERSLPDLPCCAIWLVDGFNVLHAVLLGGQARIDWWAAPQRERLLERAGRFRDPRAEIWVVFDGSRTSGSEHEGDRGDDDASGEPGGPRPRVVFAASADDWLVGRVRRAKQPGEIAVVTGDRQVAGRCRHAGSVVVRPRDFLAHCPATSIGGAAATGQ